MCQIDLCSCISWCWYLCLLVFDFIGKTNEFYDFCPKAWGVRSPVPMNPSSSSGPVLVEIENLSQNSAADQHDRKWFVNLLNQNIACVIIF